MAEKTRMSSLYQIKRLNAASRSPDKAREYFGGNADRVLIGAAETGREQAYRVAEKIFLKFLTNGIDPEETAKLHCWSLYIRSIELVLQERKGKRCSR